ncbi:MAG: cation diffusion facilitator family transporter [Clostridia bacterium]
MKNKANKIKNRNSFGILSGIVGIFANTFLCASKLVLGFLFKSVSVMADGINNLSDVGSSMISIIGFKLSDKPADKKHPFGHARIEYILSLIIGITIIIIGAQLLTNSFDKIINKGDTTFSYLTVAILCTSILLKIFLSSLNYAFFKKTNSLPLKATAQDALNDIISTTLILISAIISRFTGINLDGFVGIFASILIAISGIKIIIEALHPLLGESPCHDLVNQIVSKIGKYEGVLGIHDLTIHNYGPNRNFASVHVEVDAKISILDSHDMIDNIERDLKNDGIHLVIHMDPIVIDNNEVSVLRLETIKIVQEIDPELTLHDFRVAFGTTHNNLIFDIVVPQDFKMKDAEIIALISEKISEKEPSNFAVIEVDHNYIS